MLLDDPAQKEVSAKAIKVNTANCIRKQPITTPISAPAPKNSKPQEKTKFFVFLIHKNEFLSNLNNL